MSYTEEEIRKAYTELWPASGQLGRLLAKLTELGKKNQEFADTDTITVREFRAAYAAADDSFDDDSMLAYIREHREPHYPIGTVYQDSTGTNWLRHHKGWLRFGSTEVFPDDKPSRPLKKMKVQ